ncbi:hypothetical protein ASPBRDRAFT_55565 [Aspergillus brasiliensis CBS 101740]|uniref:Uncharacterized protein n=1 Tax=Aspergillus brasiliensis (strain CBS 101740 / IMI 381727 / IBT 21946) TaxID=767769 RepID=A0A1L9UGU5_ASPBC|nr:hypothetical protein ASPBRDRAFT_55565 [Aspergillus brasiliensis CBS 101740]
MADEEWIAAFSLPLGLAGIPVGGRKFRALTIDTTADPLPVCLLCDLTNITTVLIIRFPWLLRLKRQRRQPAHPCESEVRGADMFHSRRIELSSPIGVEFTGLDFICRTDIRSMYMPTRRGIAYAHLHDDLPGRGQACGMLMNLGATALSATLLARNQHVFFNTNGPRGKATQQQKEILPRPTFRSETFANNRGALVNNAPSNPVSTDL